MVSRRKKERVREREKERGVVEKTVPLHPPVPCLDVCHPRDSHHPQLCTCNNGATKGARGNSEGDETSSLCLIRKHCNCLEYYIRYVVPDNVVG